MCIPFSLSQGAAWSAWLLAVKILQCTGWIYTTTQGVGLFCEVYHCSYTSRTFFPDHQMTGHWYYKTYLLALFNMPSKILCILQCAKQECETPMALWASQKSFLYYSRLLQWIPYTTHLQLTLKKKRFYEGAQKNIPNTKLIIRTFSFLPPKYQMFSFFHPSIVQFSITIQDDLKLAHF